MTNVETENRSKAVRCIVITGKSGAGMSTVLKALEDQGHAAVDNLPLALLPPLLDQAPQIGLPLAVVVDSRTFGFSADALADLIRDARARPELRPMLLFVDCDFETLQRRYTETRRRHPLAKDRPVADGIKAETVMLRPLVDHSDLIVDTSLLTIHDLRRWIAGHFALSGGPGLTVNVMSFSFRRGLPREADLVFDVRFLTNPHWDLALRPLTGLDKAVQEAVRADADFGPFIGGLMTLLRPLLPRYRREGKSYLTVAVGCTGGRHRSVFVAETLASELRTLNDSVGVTHRDLPADAKPEPSG